jgi:hypothetical protein
MVLVNIVCDEALSPSLNHIRWCFHIMCDDE